MAAPAAPAAAYDSSVHAAYSSSGSFPPAGWSVVGAGDVAAAARARELADELEAGTFVDELDALGVPVRFFAWEEDDGGRAVGALRWEGATLGDASSSPGLPTASVEVDLENASGASAGIVQDTAYVDAAAWAGMQADVTAYASSKGYDIQTYPKAAGSSYSGGYWTDAASVKNWIARIASSGDLATSPTSTSSTPAASSSSSSTLGSSGLDWTWIGVLAALGFAGFVVYAATRPVSAHASSAERRRERDDFAEQNIPDDLVPLWRQQRGRFKGTPHERSEAFLEWAETDEGERARLELLEEESAERTRDVILERDGCTCNDDDAPRCCGRGCCSWHRGIRGRIDDGPTDDVPF